MYNKGMKQFNIVLGFLLLVGCAAPARMVGADRDEHGCIGSAGYTWSEEYGQCVRPWEQPPTPTESSRAN